MANDLLVPALGATVATQDQAGRHLQRVSKADLAARTSKNASGAEQQFIAAGDRTRHGVSVVNNGTTRLLLGAGATVVTTINFSVPIMPGGYWESPYGFQGEIRGLWEGAPTGNAIITEYKENIS